jgi:hypothetical protein
MRHGPAEFRPFDGPSDAQLRPQWEGLHEKAETLWRLEDRVVSQDSMGTIWRHSTPTAGTPPKLALTPCWPPCT